MRNNVEIRILFKNWMCIWQVLGFIKYNPRSIYLKIQIIVYSG